MKQLLSYFIIFISVALLSSCEKSSNGDLDGMWYMTRLDSIQTGKTYNVREDKKTWSFQGKLMQVYNHKDDSEFFHTIMSRFEHSNGQLIIYSPFIYNRMDGDIALTQDSIYRLKPYGINNVPDTFHIETFTSSEMLISDEILRIQFEKY